AVRQRLAVRVVAARASTVTLSGPIAAASRRSSRTDPAFRTSVTSARCAPGSERRASPALAVTLRSSVGACGSDTRHAVGPPASRNVEDGEEIRSAAVVAVTVGARSPADKPADHDEPAIVVTSRSPQACSIVTWAVAPKSPPWSGGFAGRAHPPRQGQSPL